MYFFLEELKIFDKENMKCIANTYFVILFVDIEQFFII